MWILLEKTTWILEKKKCILIFTSKPPSIRFSEAQCLQPCGCNVGGKYVCVRGLPDPAM